MTKTRLITDSDISHNPADLPEVKRRTPSEERDRIERQAEIVAELDREAEAEARRIQRIEAEIESILSEPVPEGIDRDVFEYERSIRVSVLRDLLDPPPIPLDERVATEMVNRTLANESMPIHERVAAVQAIQRYPLRSFTTSPGPHGEIIVDGDMDFFRQVQEEDRERTERLELWEGKRL